MQATKSAAFAKRGLAAKGKIRELVPGRLCGFIEARDGRTVFFHGKDLEDGRYNDLQIGWAVTFELIVDHVSGDRAAKIRVL
jgi:cold shock CspA family protein